MEPGSTVSDDFLHDPIRLQITGVLQAKDSTSVTGKFSYHSLAKIRNRALLVAARVCSRGKWPLKSTLARPSLAACAAIAPVSGYRQ